MYLHYIPTIITFISYPQLYTICIPLTSNIYSITINLIFVLFLIHIYSSRYIHFYVTGSSGITFLLFIERPRDWSQQKLLIQEKRSDSKILKTILSNARAVSVASLYRSSRSEPSNPLFHLRRSPVPQRKLTAGDPHGEFQKNWSTVRNLPWRIRCGELPAVKPPQ